MLGGNSLRRGGEVLAWAAQTAVGAPFLEVCKAGLDGALGSLVWWESASPRQGVGLDGL